MDTLYSPDNVMKDSAKINEVTALFRKLGVDQRASEQKELFQRKAFASLEALKCSREKKQQLFDLAIQLIGRTV